MFTPKDHLKQTAEDMLHLLEAPAPSSQPAKPLAFGPPILNACAKIAHVLRRATPPAPPHPATAVRVPKISPPVAPQRVPVILCSPAPSPPLLPRKLPPPELPQRS
jgi:hypothetical protein